MTRTPALLLALLLVVGCGPAPTPSPSTAQSVEPDGSPPEEAGLHGQLAYVAGEDPQIHLLDLTTGESRQLTRLLPEHAQLAAQEPMRPVLSCGFGPNFLTWSPDGSLLAFAYGGCETVLYVVDLDGVLTRIADGRTPAWSPDGSSLVFAPITPFCVDAAGCGEPPEPGEWNLHVVEVTGDAAPRPLSLDRLLVSAGQPAFSPDGSQIAFSAPLPEGEAEPELFGGAYVIAADGSDARLVARGAWAPGWLPDGRLLIVDERTGDLHAMDLETADAESLGGDAGPAVASPDGTRLLLTASDPETGEMSVHLVSIDGDALAHIVGFPSAWAPDSSAAVVATSEVDRSALVIVGRDGAALGRYELPDTFGFGAAAWRPGS